MPSIQNKKGNNNIKVCCSCVLPRKRNHPLFSFPYSFYSFWFHPTIISSQDHLQIILRYGPGLRPKQRQSYLAFRWPRSCLSGVHPRPLRNDRNLWPGIAYRPTCYIGCFRDASLFCFIQGKSRKKEKILAKAEMIEHIANKMF